MKSGNVLPVPSVKDTFQSGKRKPKSSSQLPVWHRSMKSTNGANLERFQLSGWPSAFFNGIKRVVGCGSDKKMLRINTLQGVAVVANVKADRNWPFRHFKHHPVGQKLFSSLLNFAISLGRIKPQPTPSQFRTMFWNRPSLANSSPKPLYPSLGIFFSHCAISLKANFTSSHSCEDSGLFDVRSNKIGGQFA